MSAALLAPADEAGVAAAVSAATAAREPLAIEGRGTKRALLRPVQAARTLSTRNLTGITLYRPTELIISARAGTPLAEVEAALAEARTAMEGQDADAIRAASEKLSQTAMKMGEALYKAQQASEQAAQADGGPQGGPGGNPNEKVVDAEFEEVDPKKKKPS